ncbi:MAG: class I SAM-dependent methyltransferase [Eubacteriales bacterium]
MDSYINFAKVYDTFMDNVPYDEWCTYLHELLIEYKKDSGIVLDLGCGTGSVTERLASKGYDMIGVDCSLEMLDIAMQKPSREAYNILYLLQDMREFELYGTVEAAVCLCDSMNYIIEEEDLLKVFRLVNNYLDPGGIFIFDLNTEYKYREILGEQTIAESRDDCSFIWDNYYDEDEMVNEYELTLFVRDTKNVSDEEESENALYERFQEFHYQRAYKLDTVRKLIEESGMEFVAMYDAFTKNEPHEASERVYVIAREIQKEALSDSLNKDENEWNK